MEELDENPPSVAVALSSTPGSVFDFVALISNIYLFI